MAGRSQGAVDDEAEKVPVKSTTVLAVDLGASSGRVTPVVVDSTGVRTEPGVRFANGPVERNGLRWSAAELYGSLRDGIATLARALPDARSVAIDTWGVDYAWIEPDGSVTDDPFCYRDPRTDGLAERIDPARAYRESGIPVQAINTSTQLLADLRHGRGFGADQRLLFLPDLFNLWLCGADRTEPTIASTSQLLDVRSGSWSDALLAAAGIPRRVLPVVGAHGRLGTVTDPELVPAARGLQVHSVASHDTASAVVPIPLAYGDAYVSLGTWACVGVELADPVLDPAAATAGFANERGAFDTFTFHRSAMGMWLVHECLREWPGVDAAGLFAAAATVPEQPLIDPDHPSLFAPGPMADRIRALCRDAGGPVPATPPEVARCVMDSLATALARHAAEAARLAGVPLRRIQIVGGGSRNRHLCQALADAAGIPVDAGIVEASTVGNALVQAVGFGGPDSLAEIRDLVASSHAATTFQPRKALR